MELVVVVQMLVASSLAMNSVVEVVVKFVVFVQVFLYLHVSFVHLINDHVVLKIVVVAFAVVVEDVAEVVLVMIQMILVQVVENVLVLHQISFPEFVDIMLHVLPKLL